jgi:hypothetical protein
MEPLHLNQIGVCTGNSNQPPGKHRENCLTNGVGLIPLGDRNRSKPDYSSDYNVEEDRSDGIWRI